MQVSRHQALPNAAVGERVRPPAFLGLLPNRPQVRIRLALRLLVRRRRSRTWEGRRRSPTTQTCAASMGTSLEQLSKTYGHLLPDSADRARVALDAYIGSAPEALGGAAR